MVVNGTGRIAISSGRQTLGYIAKNERHALRFAFKRIAFEHNFDQINVGVGLKPRPIVRTLDDDAELVPLITDLELCFGEVIRDASSCLSVCTV